MLQLKQNRAAFTLIELLVVVIIVAVLAAVGVPLLSANVERARATEAESALGTIRTALRSARLENNNAYPSAASGDTVISKLTTLFNSGDLKGKFYAEANYKFGSDTTADTFCVGIASPGTGRPARSLNELGNLFGSADCGSLPLN